MVALVIGLLLTAAIGQIFIIGKNGFRTHRALARLQENARLAEFVLSHAIAHAGYSVVRSSKARSFPETTVFPAHAYITGQTGGKNESDILSLRFQANGDVRGCLGGRVGSRGTPGYVDMKFFVNGNETLECTKFSASSTPATYPIVENVERFKVRYGLDTDSDNSVDRYTTTLHDDEQKRRVRSIRFQLLLRSADTIPILSPRVSRHYDFFDGTSFEAAGRHERLLLDRTVAIRNPLP